MVNDCTDHNEQMHSLLVARVSPTATTLTMNRISLCAKDYADAMSDPFDCKEGACLPLATLVETQKSRVFLRTSFTTGTTGFGSVLVGPDAFGSSGLDSVWTTTSAYAASTIGGPADVAGGTVIASRSNAPFTYSGVIDHRLVSIGVRVTNRTQILYREGFVAGLCEPSHLGLEGYTLADVGAFDNSFREVVDSGHTSYSVKWNGVKYAVEEQFMNVASIDNCLAIVAVASGTNAQIYDVTVVGHFEYAGITARSKTMTWPDPQGVAIVAGAASRAQMHTTNRSHDSPDWWKSFKDSLVEGAKIAIPYVLPALKAGAAYYTGGAASAALSFASESSVGRSSASSGRKAILAAMPKKSFLLKDKKKKK